MSRRKSGQDHNRDRRQDRHPEPDLAAQYARIGIDAVAACARYQGAEHEMSAGRDQATKVEPRPRSGRRSAGTSKQAKGRAGQ